MTGKPEDGELGGIRMMILQRKEVPGLRTRDCSGRMEEENHEYSVVRDRGFVYLSE